MNEFAENLVDLLQSESSMVRDSAYSTLENVVPRIREKELISALCSSIDDRLRKNSFTANDPIKENLTKAGEFVKFYQSR